MFEECLTDVSLMLQVCFKKVASVFQEGIKGIEKDVSKYSKKVSTLFQGSLNNVSGTFQRPIQEFQGILMALSWCFREA